MFDASQNINISMYSTVYIMSHSKDRCKTHAFERTLPPLGGNCGDKTLTFFCSHIDMCNWSAINSATAIIATLPA